MLTSLNHFGIIIIESEREVIDMKSIIISYEIASPSVVASAINSRCINALVMCKDINEDFFEVNVCGWLPLTPADLVKIEEALACFV